MSLTTSPARFSSRADRPSKSDRRHRANFARAAVFAEFGRAAFSLNQADFVDRLPGDLPRPSPEARVR